MFASRIAKPEAKAADSPIRKLAPQRSTAVARPFGVWGEEAGGDHEQEAEPTLDRAAPRGLDWSLSRISILSPDAPPPAPPLSKPPALILQPKLAIGSVDDPLEHEADRVADQVMRMVEPAAVGSQPPPQREFAGSVGGAANWTYKTRTPSASLESTSETDVAARAAERHGAALSREDRSYFDHRFRRDFSRVRVHADGAAAASARALQARAYTVGSRVVFGEGEYAPHTYEGRRLLAHELVHVAQQGQAPALREDFKPLGLMPRQAPRQVTAPSAAQILQRAPLFETGELKFIPPDKRLTEPAMRAQLDAKTKGLNPDIASYNVKGATPADEAYIFLETLIFEFGQRTRWGTASRVVMQIGWEKPVSGSAGIVPTGLCTLDIDERGNATAELLSPADIAVAPAVTDAIKILKSTYGVADVLSGDKAPANAQETPPDPSADWTQTQLEDVVEAIGILPPDDRAALRGVLLLRYQTLKRGRAGEFTAGGSNVGMGATAITVTQPPFLKLANNAFAGGQFDIGPSGGTPLPGASQTIVHEIGHTVESAMFRSKLDASERGVIGQNVAVAQLNTAKARYAAAPPGSQEQKDALAAAQQKGAAYVAAKAKAEAAKAASAATIVPTTVTVPLVADAVAKKGAYAAARDAAVAAISAWSAKEVSDSQPYRDAADAVCALLDDYVKRAGPGTDIDKLDDTLVMAVAARKQARADLAKLGPNPALAAFDPVDQAQDDWVSAARTAAHTRGRTRRLQKFVDLVKGPPPIVPLTQYARDNPYKPEEFYAETYSLWIAEPAFLKTNYPTLFDFFDKGDYAR